MAIEEVLELDEIVPVSPSSSLDSLRADDESHGAERRRSRCSSRRRWLVDPVRGRGCRDVFLHEHSYLRRKPATVTCPNCLRAVETIVERSSTAVTHLSALLLVPLCLCALPYFSKALRHSLHRCPTCGIYLGSKLASPREAFVLCLGKREASGISGETTL